jgi:hypothetical protein
MPFSSADPETGGAYHNNNNNNNNNNSYYEYHHGTGEHMLMRGDSRDRPQYSLKCLACNCIDCLVLVGVLAFLGFSCYLAYYILNNFGG